MKKIMIAATTVATGLVFAAAPAAMAEGNLSATVSGDTCTVQIPGYTPGETIDTGSNGGQTTAVADENGNYTKEFTKTNIDAMNKSPLSPGYEAPSNVGKESGNKGNDYEGYLAACNAAFSSGSAGESSAQSSEVATAAQDNTATGTTAGVAKSNDNALVLGGAATVALVGAGTFVVRRKKA